MHSLSIFLSLSHTQVRAHIHAPEMARLLSFSRLHLHNKKSSPWLLGWIDRRESQQKVKKKAVFST